MFTPKIGEDEPNLTSIFFRRGWFNHQLVYGWVYDTCWENSMKEWPRISCSFLIKTGTKTKATVFSQQKSQTYGIIVGVFSHGLFHH